MKQLKNDDLLDIIRYNGSYHSAYDDSSDEFTYDDPEESMELLRIANSKIFCDECSSEKYHICLNCVKNQQTEFREQQAELIKYEEEIQRKQKELEKKTRDLEAKEFKFNLTVRYKNDIETKTNLTKDLLNKGKSIEEIKDILDTYKNEKDGNKIELIAQMLVKNKSKEEINQVLEKIQVKE